MKQTEGFRTASREWRISYSVKPTVTPCYFGIVVCNAKDEPVTIAANVAGAATDTTFVRTPPGEHYLKINAGNCAWGVVAEDQH